MSSSKVVRKTLVLASLAANVLGCGANEDGESVESVPVSGVVTFQGKPLPAEYQVIFFPKDAKRAAMGKTDDQGRFVMGTNDVGDGAPPGVSDVAITFLPEIVGEDGKEDLSRASMPAPVKLPAKYGDPKLSGLTVTVPAEGLPNYELKLE